MQKGHLHIGLIITILTGLLCLFPQSKLNAVKQTDIGGGGYSPSGIISVNSKHVIFVEKSSQRLLLYRVKGDDIELVNIYQCSTGKNHGDKIRSGDRKTPEGVYFFNKLYTDEQLQPKYGVMAFVLDFPNYLDRKQDKSGNGIWLHGLDRPLLPFDSNGCIALQNKDIIELSNYIKLYETPIVIEEKLSYINLNKNSREKEEVMKFLARWEHSWEAKDLERYLQCYSPDEFRPGNWYQWKKYKQSLNTKYKFISVDIRYIDIFKYNKTIIVKLLQDYESDKFQSIGFKKLFLRRNSRDLKIVGEDWAQLPSSKFFKNSSMVSEEKMLCRFLNKWVESWENRNINDYMDCYSQSFTSSNMGWKQWKQYKSEINQENRVIRVSVIKPKITLDGNEAIVTYIQKYASDSYNDFGLKRLRLNKENGSWKIVTEGWQPMGYFPAAEQQGLSSNSF